MIPDDSDASRSQMLLVCSSLCLALAWVSVALRVWVRAVIIKSFGWDDTLMVFALVIFTVFCSSMIIMAKNGGGALHVDPQDLPLLVDYMFVFETMYIGVMVVLKLSLAIFFLRIVVRPWQAMTIRGIILLVTVYSFAYIFIALFQCGPPQDYLPNRAKHECVSDLVVLSTAYVHTTIGALTDWAFVILPIYIVWHANMRTSSKVSVAAILTLGALGSIATLVRYKYVPALIEYDHFWWSAAPLAVVSTIEPALGIIAGSLATLRPLLRACLYRARTIAASDVESKGNHQHQTATIVRSNTGTTYQSDCTKSDRRISSKMLEGGWARNVTEIVGRRSGSSSSSSSSNRKNLKGSEKQSQKPRKAERDGTKTVTHHADELQLRPDVCRHSCYSYHTRPCHARDCSADGDDAGNDNVCESGSVSGGSATTSHHDREADPNWPIRPPGMAIYKVTDVEITRE